MENKVQSLSVKRGLPPGTLIHVGRSKPRATKISKIEYSKDSISEHKDISASDLKLRSGNTLKEWINIIGLADINIIEEIGQKYNIHNLVLEDILNTQHRPKIEEFDNFTFFTFKMMRFNTSKKAVIPEQVSIILGSNYVLTFQESEGDTFDSVRNRLNNKVGKIRVKGTDYLLYALIDTVVDNYFSVIEVLSDRIQLLEDKIISNPTEVLLGQIQHYKKELMLIRKIISPLRDSVGFLCKANTNLIADSTNVYFKDTYDHILHIEDSINDMRDSLGGQLDIFLSNLSNQMNVVMKVLTIIATIFIPLTFIAGIYGMNFKRMPELEWYWGYPAVLVFMLIIFVTMIFYFKRKKWL